jgi:hypothetical protein
MPSTSTGPALLSCSFAGCGRPFKSKSALTKHQRTRHFPDSGLNRSRSSLAPGESNRDKYFCPISGCLRSFKNKHGLAQHSRIQHFNNSSRPTPVTAPSPIDDTPQSPCGGPADDQMDVDVPYNDHDLLPLGSDGSHRDSTHSRSHSPYPDHGGPSPVHVNPALAYDDASDCDGASDRVKRTYHPTINGMFV